MTPYCRDVEQMMRSFYRSLRENDRRRYAAVEAAKRRDAPARTRKPARRRAG